MFSLFVAILKHTWPFFKENVLEGKTFRDWFKRNRYNCLWLFFILTLFGTVLYMVETVMIVSAAHERADRRMQAYRAKNTSLQQRFILLDTALNLERSRVKELQDQLALLAEEGERIDDEAERYENILRHCGIDTSYRAGGYPSCSVRAPKPPARTTPRNQPETPAEDPDKKRRGFRQFLRDVFNPDKNSDTETPP